MPARIFLFFHRFVQEKRVRRPVVQFNITVFYPGLRFEFQFIQVKILVADLQLSFFYNINADFAIPVFSE